MNSSLLVSLGVNVGVFRYSAIDSASNLIQGTVSADTAGRARELLRSQGRLEEALELIERAVEIDPANGAYIDSLGWVYFQLGRYEEAAKYLERAARLVPEDGVVLEHLGDAERQSGNLESAVEHYRRALQIGDENQDEVRRKLLELERQ